MPFSWSNVDKRQMPQFFGACQFQEATGEFVKAADKFMHDIENDEELKENPIKQRMVNDKLMQIEKVNFAPKLLQIEATYRRKLQSLPMYCRLDQPVQERPAIDSQICLSSDCHCSSHIWSNL